MRLVLLVAVSSAIVFAQKLQDTCAPCHSEQVTDFTSHPHAEKGISCDACHGRSEMHVKAAGGAAPDRVAGPAEVPVLCGGCHPPQRKLFISSKHAIALAAKTKTATCATCHGTHAVSTAKQMEVQCARCHNPLPPTCKPVCATCHEPHTLKRI